MSSLNQVQLIGRLGKDPELQFTTSGQPVAHFSVACGERWRGRDGETKERTEWVNVVVWGKLADIVKRFLNKGAQVYLQGKLQTRKWTDKDGADHYKTEVVLSGAGSKLVMLGGKRAEAEGQPGYSDHELAPDAGAVDDDIPF